MSLQAHVPEVTGPQAWWSLGMTDQLGSSFRGLVGAVWGSALSFRPSLSCWDKALVLPLSPGVATYHPQSHLVWDISSILPRPQPPVGLGDRVTVIESTPRPPSSPC